MPASIPAGTHLMHPARHWNTAPHLQSAALAAFACFLLARAGLCARHLHTLQEPHAPRISMEHIAGPPYPDISAGAHPALLERLRARASAATAARRRRAQTAAGHPPCPQSWRWLKRRARCRRPARAAPRSCCRSCRRRPRSCLRGHANCSLSCPRLWQPPGSFHSLREHSERHVR